MQDVPRVLDGADFAPFLSSYLSGGYRDDCLEIERVNLASNSISASCKVSKFFPAMDGSFHLAVPMAFMVVAQLAIIWAHVDNDLHTKQSEVWLREISFQCFRPIQQTSDISFELRLTDSWATALGPMYSGIISIQDDAFTGLGTFLFPVAASSRQA